MACLRHRRRRPHRSQHPARPQGKGGREQQANDADNPEPGRIKGQQRPESVRNEAFAHGEQHDADNPHPQRVRTLLHRGGLPEIVDGSDNPDQAEKPPAYAQNSPTKPEPLCREHAIRSFKSSSDQRRGEL